MLKWFFKPSNLLFAMQVGMTREVSLHVKGVMLTNDTILTRTSDVVSFAATRPGVTQAPPVPPPRGVRRWGGGGGKGGRHYMTQARAAAKETTSDEATVY